MPILITTADRGGRRGDDQWTLAVATANDVAVLAPRRPTRR